MATHREPARRATVRRSVPSRPALDDDCVGASARAPRRPLVALLVVAATSFASFAAVAQADPKASPTSPSEWSSSSVSIAIEAPPAAPSAAASPSASSASSASPAADPEARPPFAGGALVSDGDPREGLDPFPSVGEYLGYGVAFNSEGLLTPGGLCNQAVLASASPVLPSTQTNSAPCVLGSGGGLSFSGSYRSQRHSLGAAYEVTFHDTNNIYQRGVLQQIRFEYRVRPSYLTFTDSIAGFLGAGGGVVGYGDNWAIATWGPVGHLTAGTEFDLGVKVSFIVAIAYRAIYFRSFVDAIGLERPSGLAHMLGLTLGFELRDPL